MNPKSQELPNLSFDATQVAFDSVSQSLILANPSHLSSYALSTQTISSQTTWAQPSDQPSDKPSTANLIPLNSMSLKFIPSHTKSKVHISPSGLMATNLTTAEELIVANIGFKTGVHYWEIICPKRCKDIHVGVIQEGWSMTTPPTDTSLIHVASFKTTTPRVIGLRLDLYKGELCFWLNGNFQAHKTTKNLALATWYPCVKLKDTGTHVILNPFAVDPDSSYPIYDLQTKVPLSQVKCALSQYVIVGGFSKLDKDPVKFDEVLTFHTDDARFPAIDTIINEAGNLVAFLFASATDAERFQKANSAKKHNGETLRILDNLRLLTCVLEVHKTNKDPKSLFTDKATSVQYTEMLVWVIRNLSSLCNNSKLTGLYGTPEEPGVLEQQATVTSYKEIVAGLTRECRQELAGEQKGVIEASEAPLTNFSVHFVPKSNTLIASQGNMLKLLHKDHGKYAVNAGTFANKPRVPKDEIVLSLSRAGLATLFTQLDFNLHTQLLERNPAVLKAYMAVLTGIKDALAKDKGSSTINVKVQYKSAKTFVNTLIGVLITSVKWVKALLKGTFELLEQNVPAIKPATADPHTETDIGLPFEGINEPPAKEKSPKKVSKKEKESKKDKETKKEETKPSSTKKPIDKTLMENLIAKNLTLAQLSTLLGFILSIDESLYAMTLHEEVSNKLKRYWSNKKPRLFSAFARLASLLTYPGSKYSLIELAESGIYNTQDLLSELRHFLEPERRIEDLQNIQEDTDLWSLLKKSLPENRMVQGLPCENVPLNVSLNNLPAQSHSNNTEDVIVQVGTHPVTTFATTVSNSGNVRLWNTEVALVSLGNSNFREDASDDVPKASQGPQQVPKKDNIASEDNFLAGFDLDEFKPSQTQVQPDQGMLDTLVSMGFSVNLAKKALSLTKNVSIAAAIDKVLILQEEEKAEKSNPLKATATRNKQLKAWNCPECTFANNNMTKTCEICGQAAPEEAYVYEDEVNKEQPKETTGTKVEGKDQEAQGDKRKKNFLEDARIHSSILVPMRTSPLSPIVVGVVFEENKAEISKKYQLRFRRFMYNNTYIKRFLKKESDKGYSSLLSGTWFNPDGKEAQNHLIEEYGLNFRALEPIFMGNGRYADLKKEGKSSLFCSDLISTGQVDLTIEASSGVLVGTAVSVGSVEDQKEVSTVFLVWENNGKYSLQQVKLYNKASEILIENTPEKPVLEIKDITTHELALSGEFLLAEVIQDRLVLATSEQVQVFDSAKPEIQRESQALPFKAKNAVALDNNTIFVLDSSNKGHIIELSEESTYFSGRKASVQLPLQSGAGFLNVKDLKDQDLEVLRGILHKTPLEGIVNENPLVLSSNPRTVAGNPTKFFLSTNGSNSPSTFEVLFERPSALISLELSLSFDHAPSQIISTKDVEKKVFTSLQDLKKQITAKRQAASKEKPQESDAAAQETTIAVSSKDKQVGRLPTLSMAEGDNGGKFLPLTVSWFQGAPFNDTFSVSRVITPNNEVFCTNYPNSEFLFEHLHGKTMLVKSVTVFSKLKPIGSCGYPMGSGLIFTANYISHLAIPQQFHNMTHQQFTQWYQIRSQSPDDLEPWEPVGSFEFDSSSESITVDLQFIRPCRYILLKPTNMREAYANQFATAPIEFKFFGVSGTVLECPDTDPKKTNHPVASLESSEEASDEFLMTRETTVQIEVETDQGEWVTVHAVRNARVQEVVDPQQSRTFLQLQSNWDKVSMVPLSGFSVQEITGERLSQSKIGRLRVTVSQPTGNAADRWVISGVGVQAYAPSKIEALLGLEFPPAILRKVLLDPKEFERFNKELIKELNREDISQARKQKIMSLIADIISSESSQNSLFYSHFDLKNFLITMVISQGAFSFRESQSILRHFSSQKSFEKNLLDATLQILPSLTTVTKVTSAGLNGFFSLLTWCQSLDPTVVFNNVLEELHNVSKKIAQFRAPEYNLLRTYFGIRNLVLEKELFREGGTEPKKISRKKSKEEGDKRKQVIPLKAKLLAFYSHEVDEYLINLGQNTQVDEIRLAFEQNSKGQQRFRVQIWAVLPKEGNVVQSEPVEDSKEEDAVSKKKTEKDIKASRKLLYSKFYSESTLIQLTTYAHERPINEVNYSPSEELECLGFSGLNVATRYLLVQVSYSIIPFLHTVSDKIEKKPMPEVYGRPANSGTGEIPELQKLFESGGMTYKSTAKYPHAAYEKYDVTGRPPYKHMFGAVGTLDASQENKNATGTEAQASQGPQEDVQALGEKLKGLQTELCARITPLKPETPTQQLQEEIRHQCKEIEGLQLRLLNAREAQNVSGAQPVPVVSQPSQSLDYLYVLAKKLSQSLRKLDSAIPEESKNWRKDENLRGDKGRKIALDIFENLIAFDADPTSKEFTGLLSEVLVHNLKPNEWQLFVITIINNFLANPDNLNKATTMGEVPPNKVFSPARIIQALDKISIPTGELLSFLTNKLNVPVGLESDKKKNRPAPTAQKTQPATSEETSIILSTLASVLLLLNNSFKKVQPSETGELAPPGMRRSASSASKGKESPSQKPAQQRVEDNVEIKKLNHEESLQAAFYICVWICENTAFSDVDKSSVLALGLDLVLQIMKFAKVTGVRDLLRDPNSFLKLFMSTLKLSSPLLLGKFQGLLNAFLNPKQFAKKKKPDEEPGPDEDILAEETKVLLVHHLQTILKWLLSYALNSEQLKTTKIEKTDELAPSVWLEHICFILEFLLLAAEKITIDPKKEPKKSMKKKLSVRKQSMMTEEQRKDLGGDTLARPGMSRSLSFSQEGSKSREASIVNLDEFDKSATIPLEAMNQLITLLSTKATARQGFNLSNCTKAWTLLMKAILKIKVTTLIEGKIFSSLIGSFLSSSEDIQQTVFPEIIDLTQNMLKHQTYQKELCNVVLTVTFNTLNALPEDKYDPIAFSLMKGWLDILLTKISPKPAENYNKLPEKAFCKLNSHGALTLFVNLGSYLWSNLNLGSRDGAHNCSELTLVKLQVAEDLLRILVSSESMSNLLAVGELFANFKKYSKEIKKAVEYYINWFLLNRASDASGTPSTDSVKNISEDMLKLFQIIGDYQEVTKVAIAALITGCKELDQTLLKLQNSQRGSAYTLLQYNSRTCSTLEELFDLWVTTDAIASYVAFEVKGFEYLLDRMGVSYQTPEKTSSEAPIQQGSSLGSLAALLEGSEFAEQITHTKEGGKAEGAVEVGGASGTDEEPKEEEIANKLAIVNLPGQTWSGITPDWSINKKGVRARILFFLMNGNFHNEYCILFNLEKAVELKQIRIGFNTVWTDHTDKVLGIPSSVVVEGGMTQNDLSHIATLEQINDEGYSNFSVKVFHKNFQQLAKGSPKSLEESLESLSSKRVSYLKFRFRRPTVTFIEGLSLLTNKMYKNIAVSISFISIAGFDVKKLPNTRKKLMDTQENSALQVISKLCNHQFTETLGILANEKSVINKIRSSFDNLTSLLMPHESWLAPVFLAIASHNPDMGDWIISKFLDLSRSREHAKLVGEIMLIDNEHLFSRLERLHSFVLSELKKIQTIASKTDSLNKFNALVPFIDVLCTATRSVPKEVIEKSNGGSRVLDFGREELDAIIHAFETYSASTHNKVLIKLLVLFLYAPTPFTVKEQGLLKYALEALWKAIREDGKHIYYEMIGPVIIGSNSSAKWFVTFVEDVVSDIISKLENFTNSELKNLRHAFILLCTISYNEIIKKKISSGGWHLKFYQALKNKDEASGKTKGMLKEVDLDMLQLAVEFLKNVCVGYPAAEEELIKVIVNDLGALEAKKDLSFINNLFVPLLNAEADVPVCLHPYDPQSKRTITSGKQLPSSAPVLKAIEPIKSEILNKEQTESLLKTIQHFTDASGLSRKMKDLPWELAITSKTDGENLLPTIRQKMSKQGPFFIVLEGTNAGKKCIVGAFCSQSMAELPEEFDATFDKDYPIPMADDNFIFYYEDDFRLHFPIPSFPNQTDFGQVRTFYDGGGVVSFYYNNTERIFISLTSTQTSYVDIDLYDMKPVQEDLTQTYPNDIPAEFTFKSAEYWVLKTGSTAQQIHTQKDKKGKVNILSNVLCPSWYNANQPFNYFRATPVYNIPVSINVQKLVEIALNSDISVNSKLTQETLNPDTTLADLSEFVANDTTTNGIIDVEFDALQYSERQLAKKESVPAVEGAEADQGLNYKPTMSIFETFERNGGVERVIELALKSLIKWKDKEKSKRWFTWVQELSSFSSLPIFFGLFLKNKACMELLFQVIVGAPDSDKGVDGKAVKKWEEEEQKAVRLSYQILANVFAMNTDSKLREFAIQKQFFTRILDRIAIISKESKRRYVEDPNKKEEDDEKERESPEPKGDSDKAKVDEEDYKKKVVKKKGVGYASDNTGQNQRWNVNEYVQSKKARNEQLQGMIEILHNFINVKEWHPPKKILTDMCESALLPLLEAAFRSASLLDMAKEADLNQAYLRLTRAIAQHKNLLPCLMDLDQHYQPPQKDSIYTLLNQLKDLAQIFLNCLTAADKEASAPNQKLAQNIMDTYKAIDNALQSSDVEDDEEENEGEILDLLSQPLAIAYRTLLQGLRFDYVSMKDPATAKFKHHYSSCITNTTPPQQKMVRLAQELADLSTALPIEHTNSIFVRVDESRVDVMKALVMGASGTPYAHGAYEFDVYFDDAYPNLPPKVNLTTTGGGKVRFNPNLYSCGKVCLSLLGTWRGNASENWDPKLSTLLQVLVSIQAIIMSEEVYFNEPGFEGESGTEEGERKNEAYSNIVRYCNIKYAMIDQLKNPPKGFETVLRRHFYLKKEEIMEELNKWIKYAEHREASYTGLINDHNPSWCSEFKTSKTKYKDMIKAAIKELETELNKLPAPSGRDLHQKVSKRKEKKAEKTNINAGVANIDDIDMSYDKEVAHKSKGMNIEDEDVKDRWSRYIGAMGLDAVTKQAKASIFMSGLGALNVEIAKNIVLSGVNRFTIHDKAKTSYRDLSGQFFLVEEDIGKNRAQASVNKIQQLNAYVNVDTTLLDQDLPKEDAELDKLLKGYTLVILSETNYETLVAIDKYCRKNKIHFITTDMYGPFARVFTDFGDEFIVVDKNGEEVQEIMIAKITNEEEGIVTLLQGHTHKYEDGDEITITGVNGMKLIEQAQAQPEIDKTKPESTATTDSINNTRHKVKVINASNFKIGDTRIYTAYEGNGLAKQIKTPSFLKFQSFEESINGTIPFDSNMLMHDFLKINHPYILHIAFEALDQFIKKNNSLPKPWDLPDSEAFMVIAEGLASNIKDYNHKEDARFDQVMRRFAFTCQGVFSPLAAFLGGYVAQEAIKAITQKFMPTRQFFYTDSFEVIPDLPESKTEWSVAISQLGIEEKKHRSDGLRICVGEKLLRDLEYSNLFMVGAGAIGCELLKNYAMLGVGTGEANKNGRKEAGKIVLTDPDVIEVSNLTRQFLFREKHLRKPKSQTAAAAAQQMNRDLKGHVIARLDKVHEGTANIFTDKFFEDLTVVTNALDNVQARRYIDLRCVTAKTPLLESGTLGPKGHVQVIIPYKTESYNSQEDPKEDAEIPHCTLKMFPEETLHCVEWARDKFGKLFTIRPKGLMKVLEDPNFQVTGSQELKTLTESVKLLKKMPITFDDCIRYARIKFQKYFVNDIRQLLYTYPLDAKTKEGKPFWSLPKRPPTEITFDPTNPLHINFIAACACLRAKVFNIPMPKDARKDSEKIKMANDAAQIKVPDFKPSEDKAKELTSEVDKEGSKQATGEEGEDEETPVNEAEELLKEFKKVSVSLPKDKEGKIACCNAEEFEKDNDQNFHIDFISSLANCRASNYKLEPMDWMTVKIKAGRIIPALATTTASVAGLQTVELCKLLKKCKVEDMKNAFLSLAVPIMALSEPATAPVTKLTDKLTVNIWDRWDVKLPRDATLKDLFDHIEKTYDLVPKDVTYGSQAIYFHALMDMHGKEKEKEKRLKSKLEELLGLEKEDKYADLNVMCSMKSDTQILKGVPLVRVILG